MYEYVKGSHRNIVNLFFSMPPLPHVHIWTGNIWWTLFKVCKKQKYNSQSHSLGQQTTTYCATTKNTC